MATSRITFNGRTHFLSTTAASYVERYIAKRETAAPTRHVRPMLATAPKTPVIKTAEGFVGKVYKRCQWGKHESCPGSFEQHSICTCDCHPR